MNSKKLYYLLLGAIGLLVAGLVGSAYGADTLFQSASKSLLDARSKSQALAAQQTQLAKAKKDIAKYQSLGAIAKSVVPQDKDQAETVREIVKIANDANVKLGSITFPSSTLGSNLPAAAGGAPASKAPSASKSLPSQLKPVTGISGVYDLAITIQSDNSALPTFDQFISFLSALENNRHTALVSGVDVSPDAKNPSHVTFTLNIDEYIKP